jgi:mitochondrial cardiolipin hydrolase
MARIEFICPVRWALVVKLFLMVLVVFNATVSPVLSGETGKNPMEQPDITINLSLDLNSRILMESALGDAETSVSAVVYKFDDPKLLPVFLATLDRGVTLKVLCDQKESQKKKSLIPELVKAGAEVRTWPGNQGKLHAKFVICDDSRVLTGSWNWTKSAGNDNVELLMDIKEGPTVNSFRGMFARLWELGQSTTGH